MIIPKYPSVSAKDSRKSIGLMSADEGAKRLQQREAQEAAKELTGKKRKKEEKEKAKKKRRTKKETVVEPEPVSQEVIDAYRQSKLVKTIKEKIHPKAKPETAHDVASSKVLSRWAQYRAPGTVYWHPDELSETPPQQAVRLPGEHHIEKIMADQWREQDNTPQKEWIVIMFNVSFF